ncbi:hypothetical protein [Paenibacillus cremeus]|uniref:Uncharacterized protein n=1 Tax=Paenibacillus cremeus TaxID=2163881 RepID=A0A559K5K9_9BACL|nr:hypothetical protein [Paenibacillus cremeus]TVY07419.1 hypothetical protein FPZ49_23965 [Paenibacillus cremeus]
MDINPFEGPTQKVYQQEPHMVEALHKCKERLHSICKEHMHKQVRVTTIHGQTHDGVIVHIDAYYVYLQMLPGHSRALLPYGPYSYYNNVILPLVLFELLTIALIA